MNAHATRFALLLATSIAMTVASGCSRPTDEVEPTPAPLDTGGTASGITSGTEMPTPQLPPPPDPTLPGTPLPTDPSVPQPIDPMMPPPANPIDPADRDPNLPSPTGTTPDPNVG